MIRAAGVLAAILVAHWIVLFLVQRQLAFPAPRAPGATARPPDTQPVWLATDAGRTEAWFLPPLHPGSSPAPLLIFAHGNAELIDYWPDAFETPRRWGMAVLLVEYPGYGRSEGRPSQASIQAVMMAAYDWAIAQEGVNSERVVAYGRSLGGGAVGTLARNRPLAALILESTFTSTRAFAHRWGAPGFLVRDPFDNLAVVRGFRRPILVLHGDHDDIVPTRHGRALAAAAHTDLHLLPCGHNDCPQDWALIRNFLSRHGVV